MPGVCKFYLQGYCRNGDSCRFEHPSNRNQPNNRSSNRFGPLGNDRGGHGGRGSNERHNTAAPYNLDLETIRTELKEPPQWILSCFGPGKNPPAQLFSGLPREQSFEEMRLRHYELASQGQTQQAIDEAQKLVGVAAEQMRVALQDVNGAIDFICSAEREHPNRIDICKAGTSGNSSGAFGISQGSQTFGKPTSAAFGQPSQPFGNSGPFAKATMPSSGGFGQPSQPATGGAFGSPAAPATGGFGQPSNTASGAFGKPSAPSTGGFGQPSAPSTRGFGQPSAPSTGGFDQPSAPVTGGFGQPSAPATGGFGQPSAPATGGFGQPSAPATGGFGQPSAPATGGFGQTSTTSMGGFGQPSAPATGGLGQPSVSSSGGFGKSLASSLGAFGHSSAPTGEFGQPSNSPFAKSSQSTAPNPFAQSQASLGQTSNSIQNAAGGKVSSQRDGAGKLTSWEGKPVSFPDSSSDPCFRRSDGQWERIWFPDGEPARTMPQEIPLENYDENLEHEYQYLKQHHEFKDGVIPQFPPKWQWTSWDF